MGELDEVSLIVHVLWMVDSVIYVLYKGIVGEVKVLESTCYLRYMM